MKRNMYKFFWAWDFEKEEKWLNEMSSKGLQLTGIGLCKYIFEEGTPGEYSYRLIMLENMPGHHESERYIRFIEETGVEHVGSFFRWVYFRKKSDNNEFELFSDIKSHINHLNRLLFLLGIFAGLNLLNGIHQFFSWLSLDKSFFPVAAILCLTVGLTISYGFVYIFFKKRKLKRENVLRE